MLAFGQRGPKRSAERTPSQGMTGSGGRQRSGPTGGAAYGMPLNTTTPRGSLAFVCSCPPGT